MATLFARLNKRIKEKLGERGFNMLASFSLTAVSILAILGGDLLLKNYAHSQPPGVHNYPFLFLILLLQGGGCMMALISAFLFWEFYTDSHQKNEQERQD